MKRLEAALLNDFESFLLEESRQSGVGSGFELQLPIQKQ